MKETERRPSWHDYFMEVCGAVAKRATCDRGRSACVIARENQILVTGYVGAPTGFPHCDEVGHDLKTVIDARGRRSQHCVRTVHAEQNAICQAARRGVALVGATLYCHMTPCRACAMLIVNCGIVEVICEKRYHAGEESERLFRQTEILLTYRTNKVEEYPNQGDAQ